MCWLTFTLILVFKNVFLGGRSLRTFQYGSTHTGPNKHADAEYKVSAIKGIFLATILYIKISVLSPNL
jgi:hypothetical protein